MARSVLGLVGLGGTLIFALPAALLGVEFLIRGRTLPGVGLVVAAALMIAIEEAVTTPADLPGLVAEQTVGRVLPDPDEGESGPPGEEE